MKIDWTATGLSNHETLELTALVEQLGDIGAFNPVLPVRGGARVFELDRYHPRPGFYATARPHAGLDGNPRMALNYDKNRTFAIDYTYRSASNYKISGSVPVRGVIDPLRHALLLTILGGAEEGHFIPSQLELEDLQDKADWELDFDNEDHVWHGIDEVTPIPERPDALDLDRVLELGRQVLVQGWDDIGTISELMVPDE